MIAWPNTLSQSFPRTDKNVTNQKKKKDPHSVLFPMLLNSQRVIRVITCCLKMIIVIIVSSLILFSTKFLVNYVSFFFFMEKNFQNSL